MKARIYHNPRCSKSRATLALLEESSVDVEVINYLQDPPDQQQLSKVLSALGLSISDVIRKGESVYKELGLSGSTDAELLNSVVENPILLERPIVVVKEKAVIGRPPENVLSLIGE